MNQAGFIPSSSFIDIVLLRFLCCKKKNGSSSRSILTLDAVYSALLGGSCNQKIRPHKTAEMESHVTGDVGGSKATEELTASWPPWKPQNHRRSFFPTKIGSIQKLHLFECTLILHICILTSLHTKNYAGHSSTRVSKILIETHVFVCGIKSSHKQ